MPKFSQLPVVQPLSGDLLAGLRGTQDIMVPANSIPGTFTVLTQQASGFFYSQSGGQVNRIQDRLFVGDAAANDGQGPTNPVSADWLTLWQQSVGIVFGSVASSVMALLTTTAQAAVASPVALTVGARTFNTNQNSQNAIGIQSLAVNNSPSFTNSTWAFYGESHRVNNVVNTCIGIELDVTQRGALVGTNPFIQNFGATVALQLASGAQQGALVTASFATNVMSVSLVNTPADNGLILVGYRVSGVGIPANTVINSFGSGTGATGTYNLSTSPGTLSSRIVAVSPMFDNTVAINVQANPNPFTAGICFGYNSITGTDGVNGTPSPAIQFARLHGMFWFASSAIGTAQLYSDASATIGSPQIQLGQAAVNFAEVSSNGRNFQVALTTSSVNYPFVQGGVSGSNSATIGALGGDTNVDLGIFCAGSGVLKFVNAAHITANGSTSVTLNAVGPAGAHATVQEWFTIKNSGGTVRYLPCF